MGSPEAAVGTAPAVGELDVKAISKFFLLGYLVESALSPMAENSPEAMLPFELNC
jgi:hypothetical protein